jgi:uncharacterized membrane protein
MMLSGAPVYKFVLFLKSKKKIMETTKDYNYSSSYSSSFGNGWQTMKDKFLYLFLVTIIMSVIEAPTGIFQFKLNANNFPNWGGANWEHAHAISSVFAILGAMAIVLGIIALAYSLLILPVFKYGSHMIFVQAARKIKPDFNYLIVGFKQNYLHIVLAHLLTTALIMMGFFVLIIPGIIIACRLVFVSYLVMDKKLDPIAAVEESWRMTRGHSWTIFAMGLTSFFIFILGLICLFVGVIPAIMWIGSSFACLYESILRERMPSEETGIQAEG